MITKKPLDNQGFTVVELILALTIAVIMSGVLLMITFRFYVNAIQSQQTSEMALDSQSLLGQLTEDLRLSAGILPINTIADANRGAGWTTSDTDNILVIASPATDSSRNIIYDTSTGSPYMNEYVYFLQNGVMYKRILKNTSATGNTASTTCPISVASDSCLEDRIFSKNTAGFTLKYYDSTNAVVIDPVLARSLEITVNFSKQVYGKPITLSNTTRITQRNY